jgi:hypothetical protein
VTASAGSSTVQTGLGGKASSKKTTATIQKISSKKTTSGSKSATSTSLKRRDQPEKVGQTKKKPRMGEELTEEEELILGQEVSQLLQPLQDQLVQVIKAFSHYHKEDWHQRLETRQQLIPLLCGQVRSRKDLSKRPELAPFSRRGLPFTLTEAERPGSDYELVEAKFMDLDGCLQKIFEQSQEPPAPSTYCLGAPYRYSQSNPEMFVRDGRMGTAPVALELLHAAFRTFTYWSFLDPYPLPGSPARSKEKREINNDVFIKVYQTANQLLFSMPQLYSSHDDRLHDFQKALLLIFPENDFYEWCHNIPADQGLPDGSRVKYKVELVYRNKQTRVPLIFVEVKLELGEGGNPFWQNHRLYQSYTKKNMKSRHNGAPVFLIQLCGMTILHYDFHISDFLPSGTHLGIGGGFCDALDMPPVVLQLGGYVNLQHDYIGRNLREAVNTLWALHEAIKQIPLYVFLCKSESCL